MSCSSSDEEKQTTSIDRNSLVPTSPTLHNSFHQQTQLQWRKTKNEKKKNDLIATNRTETGNYTYIFCYLFSTDVCLSCKYLTFLYICGSEFIQIFVHNASLCKPRCTQTNDLAASASKVQGLKLCITTEL